MRLLRFKPAPQFKPGETLFVTAQVGDQQQPGADIIALHLAVHRCKGLPGGIMSAHPILPTFGGGDSRAVVLGSLDAVVAITPACLRMCG